MNYVRNVAELIGNTPIIELSNIRKAYKLKANLFAKLEYFNPTGSVKDRAVLYMIKDAEEKGILNENSVIIEPTSGNTGIGLAAIAASRGYKTIIVMPDSMSVERRALIKAYGAEIVLTDGTKGMSGAIEEAVRLAGAIKGAFIPGQFINKANAEAHYKTTGPEIYDQMGGEISCLVSGVGTGGTISGAGKYLKEKNPGITIVAVEPSNSPVLSEGRKGTHKIQGIGAGFVPEILDLSIINEICKVDDEDAFLHGREIAQKEGILVGISSGAALSAAIKIAKREEFEGKNILAILPDTGDRYLSTDLFKEN